MKPTPKTRARDVRVENLDGILEARRALRRSSIPGRGEERAPLLHGPAPRWLSFKRTEKAIEESDDGALPRSAAGGGGSLHLCAADPRGSES